MSDPLSIAGSVVGLITISAQIVVMAKEMFDKVRDAPETVKRVREEVESMQPIFHQMQLLLTGTGSKLNHNNLTMISIHNLMTTLTGCVIVYSRLEKKVNEVCGFNDPTTATAAWKRAGVIADRVKWGLWRHEEVLVIIEDLQRQKLSLNLMLTIITCTTTTEASEVQTKLLELSTGILQSNHAHSVLLRDLISRQDAVLDRQDAVLDRQDAVLSRQDEQGRALDEQARVLEEIRNRPYLSTFGATDSSMVSTPPPSASSPPSNYHDNCNSDNASIMSKRSTFSFRLGRPSYMEDLKASRAYKRLRHFGLGADSSSDSVLSFDSACSTGNWSMLSDITLGDLSVSQIAVLNLPIELADVSNPEPFKELRSTETHSRPKFRRIWSSRGRIHNAIESGNEFVIKTLLAMGVDIEELDSSGRTPLVHALEKHHVAICKILVEKGAKIARGASDDETLLTHAVHILYNLDTHDCKFLDDICEALLDNRSNTNTTTVGKMAGERIAVSMHDIVKRDYKSILVLLSLIGARDTEGWTPLASAAFSNNEALCEFLVEKGCNLCLDTEQKEQLKPKLSLRIRCSCKTALRLLLDMGADINERNQDGETALLEAVSNNHLSCVKILIERGADATISTRYGNVLHYAAWKSAGSEMMKFLLEQVVETRDLVNAKDDYIGGTPLHDCSRNSHKDIGLEHAKMLVQAGAIPTIKNCDRETPYERARRRERKELAKYLWSQLSLEQQTQEIPPSPDWSEKKYAS